MRNGRRQSGSPISDGGSETSPPITCLFRTRFPGFSAFGQSTLPAWHGRWLELIHPEDRTKAADAAAAALHPGGPRYDVEYRVVRPEGMLRVIHSQGDVTWDDAGRPLRQFGVLHDITELRTGGAGAARERGQVRAGAGDRACWLVGAGLHAQSRVLFRRGLSDIRDQAG